MILRTRYWSPDEPAANPPADPPAADSAAPASGNMIPEQVWDDFMEGKAGNDDPEPEDDGIDDDEPRVERIEEPETEKKESDQPEVPKKEEEPEAEEPDAVEALLAGINETLGKLDKKLDAEKPDPAKPESKEPELEPALRALLDHEDPAVREGAKALLERQAKSDERLNLIETTMVSRDIEAEAANVQKEMDAVQEVYGLTDEQVLKVATYLESDPVLASVLSFEEGIRRVIPDAKPRSKAPADADPSNKNGSTVRVKSQPREKGAAVIDRPAAAGASPTPQRAPEGERMEQAVDRGYNRLFRG